MTADSDQAMEMIRRCLKLRNASVSEAVLRTEFASRLRLVFPDAKDEPWINHYTSGTEAHTTTGQEGGQTASRFIDNLVGSTTIEYEADLRVTAKWDEGYGQVNEHAAGLIRNNVHASRVRGILSDTVEWHAYDVSLRLGVAPATCTADSLSLHEVDSLLIKESDRTTARRLIGFIQKHLAREQSRPLKTDLLESDLGFDSGSYRRSVARLSGLVEDGRADDQSIVLATEVWSRFVDYLEGESAGFRAGAYVDEVYLLVIARLLSANVLSGRAVSSDDVDLKGILDGTYFRNRYKLENIVEQDYFGWLTGSGYVDRLLPIAHEIQEDLYAYDFGSHQNEDLFGLLIARLADKNRRKLLGQEPTPAWLGRMLAESCLDNIPKGEMPCIVDMCCGSGSILAGIIGAARRRFNLEDIESLRDVATGFDIDPLAVSLAKTTWVIALADEIKAADNSIMIPIYHADSLFAVTPVSKDMPALGEDGEIIVSLDGETVTLPNILFQREYTRLFDCIVDWAYDEAKAARARSDTGQLTERVVNEFLKGAASTVGVRLSASVELSLRPAVLGLARRMAELAVAGRNGIWAFILRNTYRPGLLTGRFNGLVSNPPWLAMSRLADNPYRDVLRKRAELYGIRPPGQSFLHLDLGTVHLLHAVDRYLAPNASIACLIPGTVLAGDHHEPFRQRRFMTSRRSINFEISQVWQIESGTFKYPGAAVVGMKRDGIGEPDSVPISGFVAGKDGSKDVNFSVRRMSDAKTAWDLESDWIAPDIPNTAGTQSQGADLMPRTAVCIEILDDNGSEQRVNTPARGSAWGFTVKNAKEMKDCRFPGHVASRFVYRMIQSRNLAPFMLDRRFAPIAIPAVRTGSGKWSVLEPAAIRRMGFIRTARRFEEINERLLQGRTGKIPAKAHRRAEQADEAGHRRQGLSGGFWGRRKACLCRLLSAWRGF